MSFYTLEMHFDVSIWLHFNISGNLRTRCVSTFSWLNINLNTSLKVKVVLTWTSTASKHLKNLIFLLEHHLCSLFKILFRYVSRNVIVKRAKKREKTNLSLSQVSQHLRKKLEVRFKLWKNVCQCIGAFSKPS